MWNSLPLPFVCEIHKLKCPQSFLKNTLILRGACITTICLTTQSLQPADKKITTKKEALALTESKQSRSLCWWLWQVHSLAEEWGEDQNLASSSKNCCRSDFFRPLLARLVERSVKLKLLLPKQKPLSLSSQDWTETFDDDQSNRHKTSDRARQKHV